MSDEAVEAAALAIMKADPCGLNYKGEHVFCDDPRLSENMRQDECCCKKFAAVAIAAARPFIEAKISGIDLQIKTDAKIFGTAFVECISNPDGTYRRRVLNPKDVMIKVSTDD